MKNWTVLSSRPAGLGRTSWTCRSGARVTTVEYEVGTVPTDEMLEADFAFALLKFRASARGKRPPCLPRPWSRWDDWC